MTERFPELCTRCREVAVGYARIGHDRYCHDDTRSCYTDEIHGRPYEWVAPKSGWYRIQPAQPLDDVVAELGIDECTCDVDPERCPNRQG